MKVYYYHENSNLIFIDWYSRDFGLISSDYIHKIGLCFRGNRGELIKRLWNRKRRGFFKGLILSKITVDLTDTVLPF